MLLDDVGFGASSAFGGPVSMPTAERLQAGGLTYTRFHTTALCADYKGRSKFKGRIDVVQIDIGDDDHSHLVDPAEIARVATSRQ